MKGKMEHNRLDKIRRKKVVNSQLPSLIVELIEMRQAIANSNALKEGRLLEKQIVDSLCTLIDQIERNPDINTVPLKNKCLEEDISSSLSYSYFSQPFLCLTNGIISETLEIGKAYGGR